MMTFMLSLAVNRRVGASFRVAHAAVLVDAVSREEAEGIGHRYIRFACPESEGFEGYSVSASPAVGRLKPEAEWRRG